MAYRVEVCADRFVSGSGFDTIGSIMDTFSAETLKDVNACSITELCANGEYDFSDLEDGEDVKIWLRVFDDAGEEALHSVEPVWASEL